MYDEVFFLAYHLHWSHSATVELPIGERWGYVRRLIDQLERERSEIQEARG